MRQGELLGLKWQDINLENAAISVRRTLMKRGTGLLLGEPKTKKSRRTIPLTEAAVRALHEHLTRQMEEIERLGDLYRDEGLVFTTGVGTLINNQLAEAVVRVAPEAGKATAYPLPRPTPHLRHAAAQPQRPPEVCTGAPRTRKHHHNPGYLFTRDTGDGRPYG